MIEDETPTHREDDSVARARTTGEWRAHIEATPACELVHEVMVEVVDWIKKARSRGDVELYGMQWRIEDVLRKHEAARREQTAARPAEETLSFVIAEMRRVADEAEAELSEASVPPPTPEPIVPTPTRMRVGGIGEWPVTPEPAPRRMMGNTCDAEEVSCVHDGEHDEVTDGRWTCANHGRRYHRCQPLPEPVESVG